MKDSEKDYQPNTSFYICYQACKKQYRQPVIFSTPFIRDI